MTNANKSGWNSKRTGRRWNRRTEERCLRILTVVGGPNKNGGRGIFIDKLKTIVTAQ